MYLKTETLILKLKNHGNKFLKTKPIFLKTTALFYRATVRL